MKDATPSFDDEPTDKIRPASRPRSSSSLSASSSEKPYHHGNLRPALIAAAIELIGEEGTIGFQLRAVARRAGVSPAAPYRHFRNKAELLKAAAEEVACCLFVFTKEEINNANAAPLAQLQAQGVAFVKFAVSHPSHFRVMYQPGVAQSFVDQMQQLSGGQDLLVQVVNASRDAGTLATDDPAMVSLAARAMITGLAHLLISEMHGPMPSTEDAGKLTVALTRVLGQGILPR